MTARRALWLLLTLFALPPRLATAQETDTRYGPSPATLSKMVLNADQMQETHAALLAELARLKAAGEPLTMMEAAPPPVPAEENAAPLYEQAFAQVQLSFEDDQVLSDWLGSDTQPPTAAAPDVEKVQAILDRNTIALDTLHLAAQRPRCRFTLDFSQGAAMLPRHYPRLRQVARLLTAEMVYEASRGQTGPALDTLRDALAAAEALAGEPLMTSQLTRLALHGMVLAHLPTVLATAAGPLPQARPLFDYLGTFDYPAALREGLRWERLVGRAQFAEVRQDPALAAQATGEDLPELAKIYSGPLGPGLLDLDELFFLRQIGAELDAVALPYGEAQSRLRSVAQTLDPPPLYALFSAVLMSSGATVHSSFTRRWARTGLAQIALALTAYRAREGSYPPSLAAVEATLGWKLPLDPFTGAPFVYRKQGAGYVAYSVGPNLQDDDGLPAATADDGTGDIVWSVAR
ncbi:MAG TPA: hypothetical protein VGM19_06685 [Armatimonadota bacterium]|jgi:hypothetical protein